MGRPSNSEHRTTQDDALMFIHVWTRSHGYPPTVRDLCNGLGMASTGAMFYVLERLRQKGLLVKTPGRARAVKLTEEGETRAVTLEGQ